MTREEAKQLAEILTAYADGKDIEYKMKTVDKWNTWNAKNATTLRFVFDDYDYRIKKEPIYRPFQNKEECLVELQKHQPFGWVRYCNRFVNISNIEEMGVCFVYSSTLVSLGYMDALTMLNFADGTPFGIKEEIVI